MHLNGSSIINSKGATYRPSAIVDTGTSSITMPSKLYDVLNKTFGLEREMPCDKIPTLELKLDGTTVTM